MARVKLDKFLKNPLLNGAEFSFKTRSVRASRGDTLVNTKTGEIEAIHTISRVETVDTERFAKLYVDGVALAFELDSPSRKVFTSILKICPKDSDIIYIDFKTINEIDSEISIRTYQRGMRELISREFIAATLSTNKYFINPHLFFNGNRVKFMHTYIREHDSTGAKRTPKDVK